MKCSNSECFEGGSVILTRENYTCLHCHRVVDTAVFDTDLSFNPSQHRDIFYQPVGDKSLGAGLAASFCEKRHYSDGLLFEIFSTEQKIRYMSSKNSKISFAIAVIIVFNKNDLFVDLNILSQFFGVSISSLQNNRGFIHPKNTLTSLLKLLDGFAYKMNWVHQDTETIKAEITNSKKLSSGLNPVTKLAVFACLHLKSKKAISIHRCSCIVSDYFNVSRNLLIKYCKQVSCIKAK